MTDPEPSGEDEEAGPRSLPAGVADERFAANVREMRESRGMSQAEVARQMAGRGWSYYPQTVQRIEAGQRKVSVGEAEALARILRTTMEQLTWPGRVASVANGLDRYTARAHQAYEQIAAWTQTLLFARRQLASSADAAERHQFLNSPQVRERVAEAREVLKEGLPEEAVKVGRRDHDAALEQLSAEAEDQGADDVVDGTADTYYDMPAECPPLLDAGSA